MPKMDGGITATLQIGPLCYGSETNKTNEQCTCFGTHVWDPICIRRLFMKSWPLKPGPGAEALLSNLKYPGPRCLSRSAGGLAASQRAARYMRSE
jgi:hypothetical protein